MYVYIYTLLLLPSLNLLRKFLLSTKECQHINFRVYSQIGPVTTIRYLSRIHILSFPKCFELLKSPWKFPIPIIPDFCESWKGKPHQKRNLIKLPVELKWGWAKLRPLALLKLRVLPKQNKHLPRTASQSLWTHDPATPDASLIPLCSFLSYQTVSFHSSGQKFGSMLTSLYLFHILMPFLI